MEVSPDALGEDEHTPDEGTSSTATSSAVRIAVAIALIIGLLLVGALAAALLAHPSSSAAADGAGARNGLRRYPLLGSEA